ncbi:MAG: AarF/UbiB family protein [Thermodesulfobacteriota bacterium]
MLEAIRNIGRLSELAVVLVRHGFADLVERMGLPLGKAVPPAGGEKLARRYNVYARLRMVAEEMGPTFVKLGQLLSQRPDLLPKEMLLELRKLQDQVTPLDFAQIKEQVERALEGLLDKSFRQFDHKCLASASLAQVHRGVRADDGREVAVKVRKPGIVRTIEADMELLAVLARALDKEVEAVKPYDLPALVQEMHRSLHQELDFALEARHMLVARAQLPSDSRVLVPAPHLDLCRPALLTMELVRGQRLAEAALSPAENKRLGQDLVRAMMEQVLLKGFFHGDPHPGNLMVTQDEAGQPRLAMLDWGLVGRLNDQDRYQLCDLLMAILQNNPQQIVQAWADMGVTARGGGDPALEQDVGHLLEVVRATSQGPPDTSRIILEMMEIMRQHHLRVPLQYALADKALLEMEGVAHALDPEYRPVESARPYVWRLYLERWRPDVVARRVFTHITDGLHFLQDLPRRLETVLRQLERGELGLALEIKGLKPLTRAVQEGSSRVTVGLILAALIVGSSMIITTGVEPKLFGLPALGVLGYIISAVIGLWLVWSIFRSGGGRF